MKSHELAKILLEAPDCELIMQKDSEGNGYSPMAGIDFDVVYVPDSTWAGEVFSTRHTADDHCMTEKEWKAIQKKHSGYAVLFPVN